MTQIEQIYTRLENWASMLWFRQLSELVLWTAIILFLVWGIRKGISRTITDNTMRYRARKAILYIGYSLVVLLAIGTFTDKLSYFTVVIGLFTAGMAFALQEVILSIAGWVAIYAARIYKPGDRVEINGVKGDVIDIGITKTTLMEIGGWVKSDNYSGRILKVGNSAVFKGVVSNYSSDFPFLWDEIEIPVRYGSDVKLARTIILDSAKDLRKDYTSVANEHWKQMVTRYRIENAVTEPSIAMKLTDNWIAFNLRYVVDYKQRRTTRDDLYKLIYNAIELTDGKVIIASTTVEISRTPDINIVLKDKKE